MIQTIQEWLATHEWYDNHKIATILNCQRKGFWHLEYAGGLSVGVGPGADYGSCIHAGLGAYYTLSARGYKHVECERAALRAFGLQWRSLFEKAKIIDPKHTQENGTRILANYFDHYRMEDQSYKFVETEMFAIVPIDPRPDEEPFERIYWVVRADGIWERRTNGDWYVQETKSTSWPVDKIIEQQKISRQTRGYTFAFRQFDRGHRIVGALTNVLYVGVPPKRGPSTAKQFARDYVDYNDTVIEDWRKQTINIVVEWRRKVANAFEKGMSQLYTFPQNDGHCFAYNQKCSFHKLCFTSPLLADEMEVNTWTPFNVK